MELKVGDEFKGICKSIVNENKLVNEWAEIESDDMFQTENYCGGFDATEMEFCFSYYDKKRDEYWFQLPLSEINDILEGKKESLEVKSIDEF